MSPSEASASSECCIPSVTEAGCASRAHLRPASGARSLGSARKRSIPSFIELQGKRFGMVEIRLAGRMAQRPVRKCSVRVLDDCREAERKLAAGKLRRQTLEVHSGLELEPVCAGTHGDLRIERIVGQRRAVPALTEWVRGPL